jgi:CheY-like chemotaxis protein
MRSGESFMSYQAKTTVLLIEPDASLRRLIALGLQYRGMHVIEASSLDHTPNLEAQTPDLLILDMDERGSSYYSRLTALQADPYLSTLPTILLGWESPMSVPVDGVHELYATSDSQVTYLAKPFDVRALHTTIEQLLTTPTLQQAVPVQGVVLPTQSAASAPSIWPFITAAGLLLTFIGLLGLLAFTIVGLCIVVVSLLWWTIGTGTKKEPISPVTVGVGRS